MIEIKQTGMCEGCEHADLVLDCNEYEYGGKEDRIEWSIRCRRAAKCEEWQEKLAEVRMP